MSELTTIERVLAERADRPYTPTNDQKRAKSQFWTTFSTGAISPPTTPDLLIAAQHCGDSRIRQWWDTPGFRQWFWNQNEFSERLDYLANIALDQLESMVTSVRTADSARVAAIKLLLEMGNKVGKQGEAEFADTRIAAMNPQQLEEFIASRTKLLVSGDK